MSARLVPHGADSSSAVTAPASEVCEWSWPTRVLAGHGAAGRIGVEGAEFGSRALLVTDETLLSSTTTVGDVVTRCTFGGVRTAIFAAVTPDPDLRVIAAGIEACRRSGAQVVIGVGGGSVLDVAKAIAVGFRNPAFVDASEPAWRGGGGVVTPDRDQVRRPLPTILAPTTLGTGAEVNAVACLRRPDEARKRLVVHPALRGTLAVIDPALTVTLPLEMALGGAFETLTRVLVPYLTDTVHRPVQDAVSMALMAAIVEQGERLRRSVDGGDVSDGDVSDGDAAADARLALALAAVASHTGWSATGRNPTGHVLWYLANPAGPHFGVSKIASMAALFPTYLRTVASGCADRRLGDPERLQRVGLALFGATTQGGTVRAFMELVGRWGLPRSLADLRPVGETVEAHAHAGALADEALSAWGNRAMLGWVEPHTLTSWYCSALRPFCFACFANDVWPRPAGCGSDQGDLR